ncbi:hypothetical protein M1C59_12500 [Gordonia terrae]|nr:hypothetical protein [Gordonia terrae]UPW11570.1 hypothetical protein M1C59_12500 [Gordonia terrae]
MVFRHDQPFTFPVFGRQRDAVALLRRCETALIAQYIVAQVELSNMGSEEDEGLVEGLDLLGELRGGAGLQRHLDDGHRPRQQLRQDRVGPGLCMGVGHPGEPQRRDLFRSECVSQLGRQFPGRGTTIELERHRPAEDLGVVGDSAHGLEAEAETADLVAGLVRQVGVKQSSHAGRFERPPLVRHVERVGCERDLDTTRIPTERVR